MAQGEIPRDPKDALIRKPCRPCSRQYRESMGGMRKSMAVRGQQLCVAKEMSLGKTYSVYIFSNFLCLPKMYYSYD